MASISMASTQLLWLGRARCCGALGLQDWRVPLDSHLSSRVSQIRKLPSAEVYSQWCNCLKLKEYSENEAYKILTNQWGSWGSRSGCGDVRSFSSVLDSSAIGGASSWNERYPFSFFVRRGEPNPNLVLVPCRFVTVDAHSQIGLWIRMSPWNYCSVL